MPCPAIVCTCPGIVTSEACNRTLWPSKCSTCKPQGSLCQTLPVMACALEAACTEGPIIMYAVSLYLLKIGSPGSLAQLPLQYMPAIQGVLTHLRTSNPRPVSHSSMSGIQAQGRIVVCDTVVRIRSWHIPHSTQTTGLCNQGLPCVPWDTSRCCNISERAVLGLWS